MELVEAKAEGERIVRVNAKGEVYELRQLYEVTL